MKTKAKRDAIWCAVYGAEVSRYVGESFAQGRSVTDEMMRRAHDEAEAAANWNAEVRREAALERAKVDAANLEYDRNARGPKR
jgi:hypothetical protein